jgi:hypothetical protein
MVQSSGKFALSIPCFDAIFGDAEPVVEVVLFCLFNAAMGYIVLYSHTPANNHWLQIYILTLALINIINDLYLFVESPWPAISLLFTRIYFIRLAVGTTTTELFVAWKQALMSSVVRFRRPLAQVENPTRPAEGGTPSHNQG